MVSQHRFECIFVPIFCFITAPNFGDIVNSGAIHPQKVDNKVDTSLHSEKEYQDRLINDSIEDAKNMEKGKSTEDTKNMEKEKEETVKISPVDKNTNSKNTKKDSTGDELSSNTKCDESWTCDKSRMDENIQCENCMARNLENISKTRTNLIQQRKSFFQKAGSHVYDSFFKLIKKHNKAGEISCFVYLH